MADGASLIRPTLLKSARPDGRIASSRHAILDPIRFAGVNEPSTEAEGHGISWLLGVLRGKFEHAESDCLI
jgi:hypothetical protein